MRGDRRDQEGIQRPPESGRLPRLQRQRVGITVTRGKGRTSACFPLSKNSQHPPWSMRRALSAVPLEGEGLLWACCRGSICLERDQASASASRGGHLDKREGEARCHRGQLGAEQLEASLRRLPRDGFVPQSGKNQPKRESAEQRKSRCFLVLQPLYSKCISQPGLERCAVMKPATPDKFNNLVSNRARGQQTRAAPRGSCLGLLVATYAMQP